MEMPSQQQWVDAFQRHGVTFFTGVPDSLLNDFCTCLGATLPKERHVIAANEGNAVALAAGHYFGTRSIPLVYMQNSGMGNALNPLVSLADEAVYRVPMILLIGWRGDPSIHDWEQHRRQGNITLPLLDTIGAPYRIVSEGDDPEQTAAWAVRTAAECSGPVALVAKKGVFSAAKKARTADERYPLSREDAIRIILSTLPKDTVYSATTGRATRELSLLRDELGQSHACDFLNVGSMGHASSVAMGMALARPKRLFVCLDGDSAAIMHLGALSTAGKLEIPNFLHIVLNNGVHESVGGQPSAGACIDLTSVAAACGYRTLGHAVSSKQEIQSALQALSDGKWVSFLEIKIHMGMRENLGALRMNHHECIEALMNELNGAQ